jgi:FkbM family methyltransferase
VKHTLFIFILLSGCLTTIQADNLSKAFIATFLPENPIILDAGAHNGSDSREFSFLFPSGTIIACEPVPNLFQVLKANTQDCHNIIYVQKALSNKRGQEFIYISKGGDASSSLLKPEQEKFQRYFPHITFPYKILVETLTLDQLAEELNIDHLDFLCLDLQGVELTVLKAAPKILKTVKAIYTEVNYTSVYEGTPLYPEIKSWMEENGFIEAAQIVHHSTFGDVLFVRK